LATSFARKTDQARQDWKTVKVLDLFNLPFNNLIHQAQTTQRQHFDANKVPIATLLTAETGSCPDDHKYCRQSVHYNTGLDTHGLPPREPVMSRETQSLCFLAGINSIFGGDKLLTMANPEQDVDQRLLSDLSLSTDTIL